MKLAMVKIFLLLVGVGVVSAQFRGKPGDCPPATAVDVCSVTCRNDIECPAAEKCCPTACRGTICIRPVSSRPVQVMREKPGLCPETPSGPWVCSNRCTYDVDCRGSKKCCTNRCGALACTRPEL